MNKPIVPLEHEEQAAVVKCAALRPWGEYFFHVPNEREQKTEAIKMQRQGVKRGLPDLWLIYTNGMWAFSGLVIELKRRNASPSSVKPDQWAWLQRLGKQRFASVVCKGAEEAIQCLDAYYVAAKANISVDRVLASYLPANYHAHPEWSGVWVPKEWVE